LTKIGRKPKNPIKYEKFNPALLKCTSGKGSGVREGTKKVAVSKA
jgi:hypothetical protein